MGAELHASADGAHRRAEALPTTKGSDVRLAGDAQARRIRRVFEAAGYAAAAVKAARRKAASAPPLESSSASHAVRTLVDLFFHARPVAEEAARHALTPVALEEWIDAGLVAQRDGLVAPLAKLAPYGHLLLASDIDWTSRAAPADAVMGLTNSSIWLGGFTIRRRVRSALDLGCGGGLQALLATAHSERVVAVDANPRALAFGQFNARLNGISNIEFLHGDLFEPVAGARFDLIVCNPPFIVSPGCERVGRENPLGGDALVERIARSMPAHLNEDGYGQMVCDWIEPPEQAWYTRLAPWFQDSGCDAWVLRGATRSAAEYVGYHLTSEKEEVREAARQEWLAYLQREQVRQIGFGVISLRRRRSGPNWFRADGLPENVHGAVGEAIERGFTAADFLASPSGGSNRALLDERVKASPDLRVEPQLEGAGGGWRVGEARLALRRGLTWSATVRPAIMNVVLRCDGRETLGKLLEGEAAAANRSPEELAPGFLASMRQLIAFGFLLPVRAAPERHDPGAR